MNVISFIIFTLLSAPVLSQLLIKPIEIFTWGRIFEIQIAGDNRPIFEFSKVNTAQKYYFSGQTVHIKDPKIRQEIQEDLRANGLPFDAAIIPVDNEAIAKVWGYINKKGIVVEEETKAMVQTRLEQEPAVIIEPPHSNIQPTNSINSSLTIGPRFAVEIPIEQWNIKIRAKKIYFRNSQSLIQFSREKDKFNVIMSTSQLKWDEKYVGIFETSGFSLFYSIEKYSINLSEVNRLNLMLYAIEKIAPLNEKVKIELFRLGNIPFSKYEKLDDKRSKEIAIPVHEKGRLELIDDAVAQNNFRRAKELAQESTFLCLHAAKGFIALGEVGFENAYRIMLAADTKDLLVHIKREIDAIFDTLSPWIFKTKNFLTVLQEFGTDSDKGWSNAGIGAHPIRIILKKLYDELFSLSAITQKILATDLSDEAREFIILLKENPSTDTKLIRFPDSDKALRIYQSFAQSLANLTDTAKQQSTNAWAIHVPAFAAIAEIFLNRSIPFLEDKIQFKALYIFLLEVQERERSQTCTYEWFLLFFDRLAILLTNQKQVESYRVKFQPELDEYQKKLRNAVKDNIPAWLYHDSYKFVQENIGTNYQKMCSSSTFYATQFPNKVHLAFTEKISAWQIFQYIPTEKNPLVLRELSPITSIADGVRFPPDINWRHDGFHFDAWNFALSSVVLHCNLKVDNIFTDAFKQALWNLNTAYRELIFLMAERTSYMIELLELSTADNKDVLQMFKFLAFYVFHEGSESGNILLHKTISPGFYFEHLESLRHFLNPDYYGPLMLSRLQNMPEEKLLTALLAYAEEFSQSLAKPQPNEPMIESAFRKYKQAQKELEIMGAQTNFYCYFGDLYSKDPGAVLEISDKKIPAYFHDQRVELLVALFDDHNAGDNASKQPRYYLLIPIDSADL